MKVGGRLQRMARAGFNRNRLLAISALGGATLLVTGLLIGRFAIPADLVEQAPARRGLVTVPVANGTLENVVTLRGEIAYSDAVDVHLNTAALSGPATVTGRIPRQNAQLKALSVALEVAGRPLIVLPGRIPAYRTLQIGMSGRDVAQFKQAMHRVGIRTGDWHSDRFDEATAAAVGTLYSRVGYSTPVADATAADAIANATSAVRAAEVGVESATDALHQASAGPTAVEIRTADNAVASAQRALDAATNATPRDDAEIANLRDALELARLQRRELNQRPDVRPQLLAVTSARSALTDARAALAAARQKALPVLPAAEVLFLDQLPRRIDHVDAVLGSVLADKAMTVSGASLGLQGTVSSSDAKLVKAGDRAMFDLPGGGQHPAAVSRIEPGTSDDSRPTIILTPDALTPDQVKELDGTNVRVQIPIASTKGDVLSVPAAALSAGPGGETRVQVVDGDPKDGSEAQSHLVVVETGLGAQGAVEVRPKDGTLAAGDLVVVGR